MPAATIARAEPLRMLDTGSLAPPQGSHREDLVTASVRQLATWVGLFGLLTVGLMLMGLDTISQLLALVQLAGLVGAPLARLVLADLHSRVAVGALGVAISVSLSALAAQSLVWFDLADTELIVLATTGYGVVLALLLSGDRPAQPAEPDEGFTLR